MQWATKDEPTTRGGRLVLCGSNGSCMRSLLLLTECMLVSTSAMTAAWMNGGRRHEQLTYAAGCGRPTTCDATVVRTYCTVCEHQRRAQHLTSPLSVCRLDRRAAFEQDKATKRQSGFCSVCAALILWFALVRRSRACNQVQVQKGVFSTFAVSASRHGRARPCTA